MKRFLYTVAFAMICSLSFAQIEPMKQYIDQLMSKMTVQEKIGQLNLLPGSTVTTGISKNSSIIETIARTIGWNT